MKHQLQTIRAGVAEVVERDGQTGLNMILEAVAELERLAGEPVADINVRPSESGGTIASVFSHKLPVGSWLLYRAAPVAQQYEAGDMASASAQGFRDGVASVAQQPQAEAVRVECHEVIAGVTGNTVRPRELTEREHNVLMRAMVCSGKKVEAPQQAEAVPPTHVLVPKRMTKAMEYVTEQEDWTWGDLLAAAEAITEAEYSEMAQAEAVPSDTLYLLRRLLSNRSCYSHKELAEELEKIITAAIQQAESVPQKPKLIGWRTSDYLMETSDKDKAENWSVHNEMLPIFEGDPHTKLAAPQQAEAVPPGYVLVPVEPTDEMIDAACAAVDDLYRVDFVRAYDAAIAQQKGASHE